MLDGRSSLVGDYSFRLIDASTASTLEIDTPVSGSLASGRASALFQLTATAGQQLFFNSQSSTNYSSRWSLYDSEGRSVRNTYLHSDLELEIVDSGTYTLVLEGNSSAAINYNFQVSDITSAENEIALGLDTVVTGELSVVGARDIYTFEGVEGQRLYFDGLSNNSLFRAELLRPDGTRIFDEYTNRDRSPFILNETGIYQLILDGQSDATTYSFRLADVDAAPALDLGIPVDVTLEPGRESKLFKFVAAAGQRLFFDSLTSSGYNNRWNIYDSNNNYVSGNRLRSDSEITIDSSDTYTLILDGDESSTVNYRFQLLDVTSAGTAHELTLGTVVTGELLQLGARDAYTFSAAAGQQLHFDGLSDNSSVYARLIAPSGYDLLNQSSNSDSYRPITLRETGAYQLVLDANDDTTSAYRFRLSDIANIPSAIELDLNGAVTGRLESGNETVFYQFTAKAEDTFFLENRDTNNSNGNWRLIGPDGQLLSNQSMRNDLEYALSQDGEYLLLVQGNSSTPIDYGFQVYLNTTTQKGLDLTGSGGGQKSFTYDAVFNQLTSTTDEQGRQTLS